MIQQLRSQAVLPEDQRLSRSTYGGSESSVTVVLGIRRPLLDSLGTACTLYTYVCMYVQANTHIHKLK